MEDTVLSVDHLSTAPKSRVPRLLLAGAALGLALFAGAAIRAYSVAVDNHAAQRAWVDGGQAAIDFRPRRLSPLIDLEAIAGLTAGLGLLGWGRLRRAGEQPARFELAGHTVLEQRGDGFVFTPAPGMSGQAGPLAAGRTRATLGPTTLLIDWVTPPRAAGKVGVGVDKRTFFYGAASAAAHALLLILFFLVPATASGYSIDDLEAMRRAPVVRITPQEQPKLTRQAAPESAAPLGPKGAQGTPDAVTEHGKAKIKKVAEQPSMAPPVPVTNPRGAGVLGVLDSQRDALRQMTAAAKLPSGFDDQDVKGGLDGTMYADNRGPWGGSLRGPGPGGDGLIPGTIGVGPYHTPTYSPVHLPPSVLRRHDPKPTFKIGEIEVPPGIDKAMIRRYVHQKFAEISWCYQKQLATTPTLEGTVTTAFTIGSEGRVIEASARGMGSPEVESCVADVIRGIEFPRGQIVHVTAYPFVFHAVGEQ